MNPHLLGVIQNYKVMFIPFMVSEKQVLAMCGIQVLPVFHSFFDGWGRRVLMIFEGNIEFGEKFIKFWIAVQLRDWGLGVRELQGYRVTGLQGYRVRGLQGYRVTGLQG